MKIWELGYSYSEKSTQIGLKNENYNDLFLTGEVIVDNSKLEFISFKKRKYKDFLSFLTDIPIVSVDVMSFLLPILKDKAQFIPIIYDEPYYILNVLNVVDALDHNRTIITNSNIRKAYFNEDVVKNQLIFKVPENISGTIYVTDELVDMIHSSKFKGYEFTEIWNSKATIEVELKTKMLFDKKIKETENTNSLPMKWGIAYNLVESGKAVVSGKWKIQKNEKRNIVLGQLTKDLEYEWIDPTFWPPILIDLTWYETEKSDI